MLLESTQSPANAGLCADAPKPAFNMEMSVFDAAKKGAVGDFKAKGAENKRSLR